MKNFKIIDLTHELHSNIPTWDLTCNFNLKTHLDYKDSDCEFKFRVQSLDMLLRSGTHIDAPSHCNQNGLNVNQIPLENLIVPCIVIDVSDKNDENYKISMADIEMFENKHGKISNGSFVLFYTGWSKYWNDPKKYQNNCVFPTINADVAKLLLQRDIVGIGIDTLCPDNYKEGFYVHKILLEANKYIIENIANAQLLPSVGSTILVMPLPIRGATESPIRLIGLVEKLC